MPAAILVLLLSIRTLCFGAEIAGVWGIDSRRVSPSAITPVAVQIEQTGDHLFIVKVMAGPRGAFLENQDYVIHRDVEINVTSETTEIDFYAPAATWIIDSTGALTMRRCGRGSITLPRSTSLIQ